MHLQRQKKLNNSIMPHFIKWDNVWNDRELVDLLNVLFTKLTLVNDYIAE